MSKAKKTEGTSLIHTLTDAGFTQSSGGVFIKGKKKVHINYLNGETGPIEDWQFFDGISEQAVVHSQGGVMPSDEFITDFVK